MLLISSVPFIPPESRKGQHTAAPDFYVVWASPCNYAFSNAMQQTSRMSSGEQPLDKLVANVGGVELGEDEDVCLACDRAAWSLAFTDGGHVRGVELQFAVEQELGCLLVCQCSCLTDLRDHVVFCGALGAEGQHRDSGLDACQGLVRLCSSDSDVRQLVDGRVRDDGAVAKAQQLAVGHHHEKHGADRLAARCGAENLQGRP